METVNVTFRVDKEAKREFDAFCESVGMNLTTAFNMYIKAVLRTRQLPFEVREPRPNSVLLQAMEESERILKQYADGTRKPPSFSSAKEMFAAMDAEDEAENMYE